MSSKYIPNRCLPDKAIDLLDEACVAMRMSLSKIQKNYSKRLSVLNTVPTLTFRVVADTLAKLSGVPVFNFYHYDLKRFAKIEPSLTKRVIGQEIAIQRVSSAIKRMSVGLSSEKKRPIASFIFAGPSGVGKTETARALADFLFGDPGKIVQFDMSEFLEDHSISRLIGAPPGYVGYDQGGELTDKIKRNPFSIILFDEIEKGNQSIYNALLQVLEEGHMTDGHGRRVDFRNTIVIMTTNIGTDVISSSVKTGFTGALKSENDYNSSKNRVIELLKREMRVEFLNRVDDIVIFSHLDNASKLSIVELFISSLGELLKKKGVQIKFDSSAKKLMCERGFSREYGARKLRRLIQDEIESRISDEIIERDGRGEIEILIGTDDGNSNFAIKSTSKVGQKLY
jgi:ATP-dependent Clp protease ATP-binding subunit ClpC